MRASFRLLATPSACKATRAAASVTAAGRDTATQTGVATSGYVALRLFEKYLPMFQQEAFMNGIPAPLRSRLRRSCTRSRRDTKCGAPAVG